MHKQHEIYMKYNEIYMANARRPNATYIPLTGVGANEKKNVHGQRKKFAHLMQDIQHVGISCVR